APVQYSVFPPNFNLQPEKSFAFDVGTDVRLRNDTILSFDVFEANLTGQIYQYYYDTGTVYNGSAGPGELFQSGYVNLARSRFQGVSLDVSHNVQQGYSWALAGGLTRGYVVSVPPGFYNSNPAGAPCNFTTGANCTNLNIVPGLNFSGTYLTG